MNITMKQLICEDALYDQKSLVYLAGCLEEVEDQLDSQNVPEGRLGEFRVERIRTKMGVTLQLPVTATSRELADAAAEKDSDVCYRRCAANRLFEVEKADTSRASQMSASFNEEDNLVTWKAAVTDARVEQWAGLVDAGPWGTMLGIIRMMPAKDDSVYILRYAGTGNFTDIQMEETEITKALHRRVTR